ncbi:anaphase-promoting complex subunit 15-like [Leptidea sinapis]|uniref:anaphase-promoting complex subunit 15-like n=1 Tax=Leptidea sinapis TaxID=189913 RepID=UPI0021C31D83|nr:anaphase-promoting complex subunit 15-like [Leptidea sinapis]
MNIPFPVLFPRMVDPKWFNADSPCDEEAELTVLEHANEQWLNSVGRQFAKRAPVGKTDQEQIEEEAETDEEGNDDTDESDESHDEDEELRTSYSPARNNNELEPDSLDDIQDAPNLNASDQSGLWPSP